jgi:hypothetical protein
VSIISPFASTIAESMEILITDFCLPLSEPPPQDEKEMIIMDEIK